MSVKKKSSGKTASFESTSLSLDFTCFTETLEHKLQNEINNNAKILLSQFANFFCFLRHQVFSGDIPCSILSIILQHQMLFQNILCICGKLTVSKFISQNTSSMWYVFLCNEANRKYIYRKGISLQENKYKARNYKS